MVSCDFEVITFWEYIPLFSLKKKTGFLVIDLLQFRTLQDSHKMCIIPVFKKTFLSHSFDYEYFKQNSNFLEQFLLIATFYDQTSLISYGSCMVT